jgi:uncharacterized protein YjiS (DUF1127 family)
MRTAATDPNTARDLRLRVEADGFFTALGQGFNAYLERLSRTDEIRRLDAMSDEQLARLGISRDGIVKYVFRDRFYV